MRKIIEVDYIRVPDVPLPGEIVVDHEAMYRVALGHVAGFNTVSATLLATRIPTTLEIAAGLINRMHEDGIVSGPDPGVISHNMPDWRLVLPLAEQIGTVTPQ